jgi:ABC transporter substrate binding protein
MIVRRREFIGLVGGAAVAWPRDALSQIPTKVNRLGSLDPARPLSANSPDAATLLATLSERGYRLGGNLAYDARAKRVFDYAAAKRLPAIYESEPYVRSGGLMSYGGDRKELFQRAAAIVDRIFKGAKPGELPFEQPTRYVFMINLGVAKAMGLEIPPNLLALADEVVE